MTTSQRSQIGKAIERLNAIRQLLDGVMYYSEPITDEEHGKVRECYDGLCEVTDKLYRI